MNARKFFAIFAKGWCKRNFFGIEDELSTFTFEKQVVICDWHLKRFEAFLIARISHKPRLEKVKSEQWKKNVALLWRWNLSSLVKPWRYFPCISLHMKRCWEQYFFVGYEKILLQRIFFDLSFNDQRYKLSFCFKLRWSIFQRLSIYRWSTARQGSLKPSLQRNCRRHHRGGPRNKIASL